MKSIKTFEDFFNGNTSESNDNYPPGAANDPSAPWNKEDYDTDREVNLKQAEIKFEVVATDHREFAILKEKVPADEGAFKFILILSERSK
jgi:hypothetical protein